MSGTRGPIGKRDEERIRRNKDDLPTETIPAIGTVEVPKLGIRNVHPIVRDLYNSLSESAQSRYYEPSDWQVARLTMHQIDEYLKSGKQSAMMLASISSLLTSLLMTEGDRRRVRMEIERKPAGGTATVTSIADAYRERLGLAPSGS